jgi:hypothetical protein
MEGLSHVLGNSTPPDEGVDRDGGFALRASLQLFPQPAHDDLLRIDNTQGLNRCRGGRERPGPRRSVMLTKTALTRPIVPLTRGVAMVVTPAQRIAERRISRPHCCALLRA